MNSKNRKLFYNDMANETSFPHYHKYSLLSRVDTKESQEYFNKNSGDIERELNDIIITRLYRNTIGGNNVIHYL